MLLLCVFQYIYLILKSFCSIFVCVCLFIHYFRLNRLKESVTVFSRCLQLDPFFLDGLLARGNAFMDYGNEFGLKFAKRDYQRALRLDPFCLPARINLAYAAQMSGKQMQAWKHFTCIIEVKPSMKYTYKYEVFLWLLAVY